MNRDKIFGKILKELREKKGLSQEELGFSSGYHRTYISLLERGLKSPTLNTVFRLAEALNTSSSQILRFVESRSTRPPKSSRSQVHTK